jgi:hypothetical protein
MYNVLKGTVLVLIPNKDTFKSMEELTIKARDLKAMQ